MVPLSGLADTVTPAMAFPSTDLTVPLNSASAKVGAATPSAVAAASEATTRLRTLRMSVSVFLIGLARRAGPARCRRGPGCWNRLDISDNRVDLGRLEVVLEAGHARRAIADELPNCFGVGAERRHRQHWGILRAIELRLGMTDAAGLIEEAQAKSLLIRRIIRRLS